ncbi:MAG: hypothetical protein AAF732_21215 [Pseudomonadota bacterium]
MISRTKTVLQASALTAAAVLTMGAGLATNSATAEAKPSKFGIHVHIGHGPHWGHYPRRFRCRWLRRRAMITGSPYWWRRYRRCMWRNY